MAQRVLLNNVDHADLRVITRAAPEFGDAVNQALVFPNEFDALQREYPILFRKDANGEHQAVALLGLERDENLYLDGDRWTARHVPASLQRGPFSIAEGGADSQPMIHIDLDHPRVSREEGEPLFLPAGGNAPYLQHIARLLGLLYDGLEVNRPFFKALEELDLIEPVAIEVKLNDREAYDLPDVFVVSQDRLAALGGPDLERLNASGVLRAAYAAISSLGNMSRLIDAKNRRLAAA